jgi:hypothetical protein
VAQERLPVEIRHLRHQLLELLVLLPASHGFEVGASAEDIAAAGQDPDSQLRIFVELAPGAVHPGHHATRKSVLRLRPIQRNGEDVPLALDEAMFGIHRKLLGSGTAQR